MRIIRFLDNDGRVHHGVDHADGSATRLLDPQGVLGPASAGDRNDMFRGKTALVADDDENMRELVSTVLSGVGCTCTVCVDGQEAINAVESEEIDLIVSDIIMPHFNGYEVFSAARSRLGEIPVVLVTGFGYDPTHSLVRATQEGLTSVLYKPFTPQRLIEEVEQAIRRTTARPADALVPQPGRIAAHRLLAPLAPVDVICIGRNYPGNRTGGNRHALSEENLEVFVKPVSAVVGTGEAIRIPDCGGADPMVDGEGELAVIIGATARHVSEEDALDYVLGFTAANDVTARHWQTHGGATVWMRGKGFDTFCPLGPAIVTPDEIDDIDDLTVRTTINGTTVRMGSTGDMLRPVRAIIAALSRHLELRPGTVILTGAPPSTVRADHADPQLYLQPGDEICVDIPGVGQLANHVEMIADPAAVPAP